MYNQQPLSQQPLIKLQPVPKTHFFMKKITRIQAIDREIRKKWIKIKRQNEQQSLTTIEEHGASPIIKRNYVRKHTEFTFDNISSIKDHSQINYKQNSLKRQQILNNHKRQQEIFYGRRDKSPLLKSPKNQHNQSLNSPKQLISVESSRRRIKTQQKAKSMLKQKFQDPTLGFIQRGTLKQLPDRYEERKSTSLYNQIKSLEKVPFMLEKIKLTKKRQMQALTSKSERQLIQLSTKNKLHMKEWASQRKDLFQKLKGSRAYYIMKSPTRLTQAEDMYIF